MTTADREVLRQQLIRHEGLRLRVYHDSLGIPTIGVGRNIRDRGITAAEAMHLLENDITACVSDLGSFGWFAGLDPVRQRALIDMRFQLGPSRFRGFRKMLTAVEKGDWTVAALEAGLSAWAEQTPRRAAQIVAMLRTGQE